MKSLEELKRKIHRVNFRRWTELEDCKEEFARAAADKQDFTSGFYAYLSAALQESKEEFESLAWYDCLELYIEIDLLNLPSSKLPIVTVAANQKIPERPQWDYSGRTWFLYSHLLASTYGWTLEYIAEQDVDTVFALVQEILTDQQLEHEFQWGMSEIAYPYNKATKESKYQPLPRPYWMLPIPKPVKKMRIRKDLWPQGIIVEANGLPS